MGNRTRRFCLIDLNILMKKNNAIFITEVLKEEDDILIFVLGLLFSMHFFSSSLMSSFYN